MRALLPHLSGDGVNEKGVSIAVLTLPSEPTMHNTGKPKLATSLLIRLVLDRAASTDKAIELIKNVENLFFYPLNQHDY